MQAHQGGVYPALTPPSRNQKVWRHSRQLRYFHTFAASLRHEGVRFCDRFFYNHFDKRALFMSLKLMTPYPPYCFRLHTWSQWTKWHRVGSQAYCQRKLQRILSILCFSHVGISEYDKNTPGCPIGRCWGEWSDLPGKEPCPSSHQVFSPVFRLPGSNSSSKTSGSDG